MKNLLLTGLLILAAFAAKSQTIDTAYKKHPSCKILQKDYTVPGYPTMSPTRIDIIGECDDDNSKMMTVNYALATDDGTQLYVGQIQVPGIDLLNVLFGVQSYKLLVFQYIGTKLGLTYQ